jgi:branched-subunit amino acid transport protein AzlD
MEGKGLGILPEGTMFSANITITGNGSKFLSATIAGEIREEFIDKDDAKALICLCVRTVGESSILLIVNGLGVAVLAMLTVADFKDKVESKIPAVIVTFLVVATVTLLANAFKVNVLTETVLGIVTVAVGIEEAIAIRPTATVTATFPL